jgi:hypothetical protein
MTSSSIPSEPEVPDSIQQYLAAHDLHDTERAVAAFSPDATVTDEDRVYEGIAQIREWLDSAAREFTYTRTLTGVEAVDADAWLVENRLEGNFPGGVVNLRYEFVVRDGRIARLVIAP